MSAPSNQFRNFPKKSRGLFADRAKRKGQREKRVRPTSRPVRLRGCNLNTEKTIFDDRARRVTRNKGMIVAGGGSRTEVEQLFVG